jgi:lipoprotein-anchoring transpeptidase ErfK/SrfK
VLSTRGRQLIATARARRLTVRVRGRQRVLRARTFAGRRLPLVLLVRRRRGDRLEAYLPARPNRSTGWIRARDVRLSQTAYRIEIRLRSHRLLLRRGRRAVLRTRIGTGRAVSPTPTGRYFVTDLVRPPDPHGFFGPYALGLSAHSDVYTRFEGGDGQVGIHGTNRPDALGHDVSHGCIRVRNRAIARLARTVPLGTPVDIARR